MGKQLKKGQKGRRSNLVREDKVLDRVALPDMKEFRRVCILRGVYPREMPKEENSPFAAFHKRDLAMINSDPMTCFIREHQVWLKNAKKKHNRGELYLRPQPKAPYAQLILSRYPTPLDAIHDLDDALRVVALFAQLAGSDVIPSERVTKCRKLLAEFHYYVARTGCLNAAFISVSGFYFMATLEGEKVLWLIPHSFPIPRDSEVDFSVMLNFLELYEHLLGFMNKHFFIKIGMKYPPVYDEQKWNESFYIDSIVDVFPQEQPPATEEPAPEASPEESEQRAKMREALAAAAKTEEEEEEQEEEEEKRLFADFVFTIDHSVPRDPIAFVVKALGGRIVWDEDSDDPSITHTIIDRKQGLQESRFMKRTYVQPQWVFDCLNMKRVLPLDVADGSYAPGKELPPHLSPFFGKEETQEVIGDDEREMIAGADDSDAEVDEEIKRIAMETEYAEGMAKEVGGEAVAISAEKLEEMKTEIKEKRKEEKARLAAGTLTKKQKRLYDELKEKEESRKKKRNQKEESKDDFEIDDKVVAGEEEEEEEAAE